LVANCFLCDPDDDLVIGTVGPLRLVAGLGPITSNYVVIGTLEHVRCLADAARSDPSFSSVLADVRAWLESVAGEFLFCEHGRVPVCEDEQHEESSEHDPHCYHAHALAFNVSVDIEDATKSYFLHVKEFDSISSALQYASEQDAYISYSPSGERYLIFTIPLHMPRQLMRSLVAHAIGEGCLGDWRSSPRREEAVAIAGRLRRAFQARFGDGG
jgi:hypothetical protein